MTAKEVAEQLYKLTGTEIDKKKIEMPASIKEFGSYDAKVRLHVGVVAAFKVKVEEAPLELAGGLVITFQQKRQGGA